MEGVTMTDEQIENAARAWVKKYVTESTTFKADIVIAFLAGANWLQNEIINQNRLEKMQKDEDYLKEGV
jgi:hypothetical protein